MRNFKVSEIVLNEMFGLIEKGYRVAYMEDEGDYLTMCFTDDDGNMKDEEIDDRIYDLEYVDEDISNVKEEKENETMKEEEEKVMKENNIIENNNSSATNSDGIEEIVEIQFNPINDTNFDWSVDLYFTEDPHEEGLSVAFINKEGGVAYWEDTKELAQRDEVQQAIREKVRCLTETYVSVKYSWLDREDKFFLALDENPRERAIQVALNIVKSYTVDEGQQAELIITEDNEFDTSVRIELSYGTVFIEIINGKKSKNRD